MYQFEQLYNVDTLDQDFSTEKFLQVLLDDSYYPIEHKYKTYNKNEKIYFPDKQKNDSNIFIIEDGVGGFYSNKELISFVGKGEVAGLHNLATREGEAQEEYVKVLTETITLWEFSKSDILGKIINIQDGYLYHYLTMKKILDQMLSRYLMEHKASEERVMYYLHDIASRYGEHHIDTNYLKIPSFLSQNSIINYIGVSNKTFYKILKKLCSDEIVLINEEGMFVDARYVKE
ncbi:Crp/Fnr family transcriptional regulator [Listeria booriae]|uniref:Crp/Fnr family transcriptional regulator n=1 Tax=Listeria booriae TaxID=1552123 RepID=A0A7X0XI61_9LIST|nr:Crp/Fnr family transcriptional regulator [Listeria booriae]MBC1561233.1 Crp/Fnr family transcriptional regulator [Listeria booriae]